MLHLCSSDELNYNNAFFFNSRATVSVLDRDKTGRERREGAEVKLSGLAGLSSEEMPSLNQLPAQQQDPDPPFEKPI